MNYQLIERPAFHIVGKSILTSQENNTISRFWTESNRDGTSERICRLMRDCGAGSADGTANAEGKAAAAITTECAMLGVCFDNRDDGSFRYMIGVESAAEEAAVAAAGLERIEIPAGTWLAFESTGAMPHAIQAVWHRIFAEFLPGSTYRHAGTPDLEVYPEGDTQSEAYRCAVWIPVVPK